MKNIEGNRSMTLEKVIKMLEKQYQKAEKLEFVKNPLCYALYQVWKEVDSNQREISKEK